jgi:hypothetical protein
MSWHDVFIRNLENGALKDASAVTFYAYDNGGSGIDALGAYDQTIDYEYAVKVVRTNGHTINIFGEKLASATGNNFSDAYTAVDDNTGGLLGSARARRLVNESLRVVSQDQPWDWVTEETIASFTTSDGVSIYTLPVTVDRIVGAYHDRKHEIPIISSEMFGIIDWENRFEGQPNKLMLIGNNHLMPDPLPDAAYTIYYIYRTVFDLVNDGDAFPCNKNFTDAIISRATWLGAEILSKDNIAQSYRKQYKEQMRALRTSRTNRLHLTIGDPLYGYGEW